MPINPPVYNTYVCYLFVVGASTCCTMGSGGGGGGRGDGHGKLHLFVDSLKKPFGCIDHAGGAPPWVATPSSQTAVHTAE